MRRVTRKVENTKPARRTTKNEGSDARVKAELINLVKDGTVTWEELARACVYWMDNDADGVLLQSQAKVLMTITTTI